MLDLGIVFVNWNTRDLLRDCLASVAASAGDFAWRVVVVDNASTDGSAEMVRAEFPDVTVIASPTNDGFSVANNRGLRLLRIVITSGMQSSIYLQISVSLQKPPHYFLKDRIIRLSPVQFSMNTSFVKIFPILPFKYTCRSQSFGSLAICAHADP